MSSAFNSVPTPEELQRQMQDFLKHHFQTNSPGKTATDAPGNAEAPPAATVQDVAAFNNRREAQWGVSPRDRQAVLSAFQARPYVMLKAA